ncbi:hypothetical protein GGR56DRAFT_680927 [Xylariaceae sp. FL0804]|nr:hypothetical protein GGR56DRAFT_680927 [Xylariaceae sp. FL0804]
MAEVQARSQPPSARGRGGGRGGRGGYGGRNTANRKANGGDTSTATDATGFDDDGDVSQLRKQYGTKLDTIKELFPDWSDADILYALKETDGDVEVAATRIADGTISQWGEVSKPKKTAPRSKPKDNAASTGLTESTGSNRPARGGRADGGRGGRGRGAERARGSGRGRAGAPTATNGHQFKENQQLSVPTEESNSWANSEWNASVWGSTDAPAEPATTPQAAPVPAEPTSTQPAATPQGTGKTWASMLRQSTAPKQAPKPKEVPAPKPAEALEPLPPAEPVAAEPEPEIEEPVKEPVEEPAPVAEAPKIAEPEEALPPPDDDLTRVNLEQLPDESHPPATATAASTTADSWDPRQQQAGAAVTPLSASQAQHQVTRTGSSGFATTALKATERPVRTPSYQRRILEQQEAVRMPGNREVDRAAVQFGAFSLNGIEDDIDGDREDPETRTQPPAESPVQPRASLPPVSQPVPGPDAFPTSQKPTTSLPQAPAAAGRKPHNSRMTALANRSAATPVAPPTGPAATTAQRMSQYPHSSCPTNTRAAPQGPSSAQQPYGRMPHASAPEPVGFPQKPYEGFAQQTTISSAPGFDSFPAPSTQAPGPQTSGAFSSAPQDYQSYYTAEGQTRNTYGNFYNQQQYGQQQGGQGHHDGPNAANRAFGGYGASQNDNLSQYPQSGAQQSRYSGVAAPEAHNSGHNTPNPVGQTQQQSSSQSNQPQSNMHQQPPANSFYGQHPYFNSPYYSSYMSQYGGGYAQGGYGGGPYGKGGVYGQPHQYGMSQGHFDHSSSPATGGFGQSSLGGRDSGLGSSIDNYGRAGSAQSGAPGALGSSGFGGMHDTFGRGSGYPSQAGQSFNGPNMPTSGASANDELKPYGDAKAAGGPSPSLAAAARPGSTNNQAPAGSGLPPPQSTQHGMGGYGGYPSHGGHGGHGGLHGNQTGGSGYGLGGSAGQGNNPYSGYNNQGFANYYGGRQGQQGGWGGNYH